MSDWTGQDAAVLAAAEAAGAVMCKRRKSYIFCAFSSAAERKAFETVAAKLPKVQVQNWAYPNDPDLFVTRVIPF